MQAPLRRWGNSLALRIPKRVARELGVAEGDVVVVRIAKGRPRPRGIDLESLPSFSDPDRKVSVNHDSYLYGRRAEGR